MTKKRPKRDLIFQPKNHKTLKKKWKNAHFSSGDFFPVYPLPEFFFWLGTCSYPSINIFRYFFIFFFNISPILSYFTGSSHFNFSSIFSSSKFRLPRRNWWTRRRTRPIGSRGACIAWPNWRASMAWTHRVSVAPLAGATSAPPSDRSSWWKFWNW